MSVQALKKTHVLELLELDTGVLDVEEEENEESNAVVLATVLVGSTFARSGKK